MLLSGKADVLMFAIDSRANRMQAAMRGTKKAPSSWKIKRHASTEPYHLPWTFIIPQLHVRLSILLSQVRVSFRNAPFIVTFYLLAHGSNAWEEGTTPNPLVKVVRMDSWYDMM